MFTLKALKKFSALFIILFLCAGQIFAQNNNKRDEPISEGHYEILKKRKELIEQENSSDKNEWSGTYSLGDHHPTVFMWSASQGFLAWGSNHTFFPSRINFGKAEFSNNRLIIKPEVSKEHLNFQSVPIELVPVKWGEQHFLISANELEEFAYAVHSGAESQIVQYFVKTEDYEKPRKGLPNLPKELETILAMKPINAKITVIKNNDKDDVWNTEVILNRGRTHRVIEGMIFYYATRSAQISIVVTDLQEKTATAKIFGIGGNDEEIKPKIGLNFSSKIPKLYNDF